MKLKTAVVLAGGAGVRLTPITENIPKVMVRVNGKPLLEWVLRWLKHHEIRNIVIGVAYLKETIISHFRDGSKYGLHIQYSEHTVEGGTAEGFRLAISRYVDDQDFLALNSDQITELDPQKLAQYHWKHQPTATIAVNHPRIPFGQLRIDRWRNIVGFSEKPKAPFFCNMGIYVFNHRILEHLPRQGDIEKTVFPTLAAKAQLKAYVYKGFFLTINTPKDLAEAEEDLRNRND